MTERNFTEVVPGFYRMRSGGIAEIVQMLDAHYEKGNK